MQAVRYDRFGDASVMSLGDHPEPQLGDGQVVVRIEARSVNLIDLKVRSGMMGPLVDKRFPKIPGADFAGAVVAIGSNVSGLAVGDRVFGAANPFKGGAFAERIAVPSSQVAPVPAGMTSAHAAAIPVAGLAALQYDGRRQAGQSGSTKGHFHGARTTSVDRRARTRHRTLTGVAALGIGRGVPLVRRDEVHRL